MPTDPAPPPRPALAALLALAWLAAPAPAAADDCTLVYDESFRASIQKMFGKSIPKTAGRFSSMAECRAKLDSVFSDPQYRNDAALHRTTCACDGSGGGGGGAQGLQAPRGGTLEQQLVGQVVQSILGALFAALDAPPGPDGEALRKEAERQWAAEEAARRAADQRRDEEAFRRAQRQASAPLAGRGGGAAAAPPTTGGGVVHLGAGTMPALLRGSGRVTEAEWAESRARQARIDLLRTRRPPTPAEARELAGLEASQRATWRRAVAVPGLGQTDRDALRLKLAVADEGAEEASVDALLEARAAASRVPATAPTQLLAGLAEGSTTFGVQAFLEAAGEAGAEKAAARLAGEGKKVVQFGDAYAVVGVGVALAQGKPEETAAPVVGWVLGKVVSAAPTLGLGVGTAQGVGAVTTTMVRKSVERLVEATDEVVPGFLPPGTTGADWWKEMKAELTPGQQFVGEAFGW